jgi:competence protein ComEC
VLTATRATGPLLLVAAVVAGILVGERVGPGPAVGALAVAVVAAAGAAVAWCAGPSCGRIALALMIGAAVPLGAAVMERALDGLEHSPLSQPIATRADATISGALVDDPQGARFASSVLLHVDGLVLGRRPSVDAGGRTVLVRASGDAAPRLDVLEAGDRVTVRGWFRPLDEFEGRYRWRHAVGTFEAVAVIGFTPPATPLARVANAARGAVLRGTQGIPRAERAIVAGFLVGDTRDAPAPVVEQFRASGLSHLLVVSGENVGE